MGADADRRARRGGARVRAGALRPRRQARRSGRIDKALEATNAAIAMQRSWAPAWELKGSILWSQRRYDEARPVYEHFLELQPRGEAADTVRALLGSKAPAPPP